MDFVGPVKLVFEVSMLKLQRGNLPLELPVLLLAHQQFVFSVPQLAVERFLDLRVIPRTFISELLFHALSKVMHLTLLLDFGPAKLIEFSL